MNKAQNAVSFAGEFLKTALFLMKKNKVRTTLSLLGIMIGVASVVAILSLGGSAAKNIAKSFEGGAMDVITVTARSGRNSSSIFTEEFADAMERQFDFAESVIVRNERALTSRYRHNGVNCSLIGTTSTFVDFYHLRLASGAWFSMNDNLQSAPVCVLGSEVADILFEGEDPIGKYIKVLRNQARSYMVIGVLEDNDDTVTTSTCIYMPFRTFAERINRSNSVSMYLMKVKDGYDPAVASDELSLYLDSLVSSDGYSIFSKATLISMVSSVTRTFYLFIAGVGAISLLVGGIGIMNIMLVSVSERIREIGIRKALGATPGLITVQFIIESVVMTSVAGILGVAFGTIASAIIMKFLGWPLSISFSSYLVGFLFSFVVGVAFGSLPARKAAKVDIVVSLAHE